MRAFGQRRAADELHRAFEAGTWAGDRVREFLRASSVEQPRGISFDGYCTCGAVLDFAEPS